MSQSLRQSELFAAQDWQVLYRAFTQINFNASDPVSINAALREYIRTNYAEDFSDWIESSEFIAIIDLLSWLAGTLAFKTDINARENFLEDAEARESILRLARFLSYNPSRNQAARGLLKLQSIQTDDDVYDSFGNNMQNVVIKWNNPDDADWFEKTVIILNNAFVGTNPFGIPLKNGTLSDVRTQLYRLNTRFGNDNLTFKNNVGGSSLPFELINTNFDPSLGFYEENPDLDGAMQMVYRSDGNGNASVRTGFFAAFKQGQLQSKTFNIVNPTENQIIDIDINNINQSDVWVQTVNDAGEVLTQWTKVPAIFSENITFNSVNTADRNIFSVITRDNDQISIRFADGRFGAVPIGNIRVWYRTSIGQQYAIRPSDMRTVTTSISYFNRNNVSKNLTMTFALQETVSNATARETDEQIRVRAPQVYAAQNRMVSGEDYNTFPLQSNLALKIKALTRVYSGHSRYIDLNDPTGNYRDLNIFSDDGIFYKEKYPQYSEVSLSENKTIDQMISTYIQPLLKTETVNNYVMDYLYKQNITIQNTIRWNKVVTNRYSSTGWFDNFSTFLVPGTNILFSNPDNTLKWVAMIDLFGSVTDIPETGFEGPVRLAEPVSNGSKVRAIIPPFSSTLPTSFIASIKLMMQRNLSFSIWYDYNVVDQATHWSILDLTSVDTAPFSNGTSVKVMTFEYLSDAIWRFTVAGTRYIFESINNVQFYFDGKRAVDVGTGQSAEDIVRILKINESKTGNVSLERDYDLSLETMIYNNDGSSDPKRMVVRFRDSDEDGCPDDPDLFYRIIPNVVENTYLFWGRGDDGSFAPIFDTFVYENSQDRYNDSSTTTGTVAFDVGGDFPETFWIRQNDGNWIQDFRNYRYGIGRGTNVASQWTHANNTGLATVVGDNLKFQWKHYAPSDHRIDPSKTNIIDMFVLTNEYDFLIRQWIANGADSTDEPDAPTELDLRTSFSDYDDFKMFSDDIVWRPVKYKYLFGTGAEDSLRAQFKVVKLPNTSLSDGEIKSKIIQHVSDYFDAKFWDFGETFYYTELAAYIHQQMATNVGSIVIVPTSDTSTFGDVFEVVCRGDEIFISTATVNDVILIDSNTTNNLRIR